MKNPKRACITVLLKSQTGPSELVKVRQTLSIVGDSLNIGLLLDAENFVSAVYGFPSIGDINEEPFLLFCKSKNIQSHQLPHTRHFAEALTQSKFPGSSLEMHLSVDIRSIISRKTWIGDREKYVVRL